jgi:hypothetical protein
MRRAVRGAAAAFSKRGAAGLSSKGFCTSKFTAEIFFKKEWSPIEAGYSKRITLLPLCHKFM